MRKDDYQDRRIIKDNSEYPDLCITKKLKSSLDIFFALKWDTFISIKKNVLRVIRYVTRGR